MGKQLIWIFACLALAFLGDRLVGSQLHKLTETSQFRYSRLYNSNETADILFVGNSRGLTFYQPEVERLTGQKTMNLSYNGMPADLAKTLVMDYLERHVPPKVMIVDVTLCDRYNESLKTSMNLYVPFSRRLGNLIKNSASINLKNAHSVEVDTTDAYAGRKVYYGGKISQLYQHNSEIFQRVLYHRNKLDEDWIVDRIISESATKDTAFRSYQVRMFPVMVNQMKEMIDFAKEKGVIVKLVINPYHAPFAETIRDSFLTPLKMYVETQTGMLVSDFSTALQNIDEIGDYQHANKKGSIHYMNILSQNGIFNAFTNSVLNSNTGQFPDFSLLTSAKDNFINYTNTTLQSETFSEKKSLSVSISPPSVSEPLKPVLTHFEEKKSKIQGKKKPQKRHEDYGYSVDTVGLYRLKR